MCLQHSLKDGLNYGLYLPEYNGRAGKFLDDERILREYPLSGSATPLEVSLIDTAVLNIPSVFIINWIQTFIQI